ncbi:hypothetical protein WJX72_002589 [[Myrmecia] bisecta]|uniref:Chlorophyll a-b binding protein, chloroplastic n=1 Tax=[Myrmecia] bisecta TaxID=41462 RepID=A0AAW1R6F8_9CHLO
MHCGASSQAKSSGNQTFAGQRVVSRAVVRPHQARIVTVAAADRPTWYPGATPPKHLDGSLPGDYGFDPLRLGTKPEVLEWFVEAERTNGRWAMAAVAGILFTELIGKPAWFNAGAETSLPLPLNTLVLIEIALFAVLEAKRFSQWQKTREGTNFDPMGMTSDETRLKEVKNGRLAMVAFLGFASQAAVRGLGPIACLKLHLEDPYHNNIYTSQVGTEFTLAVCALSVWPIVIEARKSLGKDDDGGFRPIPF